MSRLEFMQRLAALVPRPRPHLIRFHGVLAPNAKLRAQVVPQMVPQEPEPPVQAAPPAECEATFAHHRPVRLSWAKLLKRVFEIDMAHCPNCGGELKIIAAILERPVRPRRHTRRWSRDGAHTSAGDPQGDCCEECCLRPCGLTTPGPARITARCG